MVFQTKLETDILFLSLSPCSRYTLSNTAPLDIHYYTLTRIDTEREARYTLSNTAPLDIHYYTLTRIYTVREGMYTLSNTVSTIRYTLLHTHT